MVRLLKEQDVEIEVKHEGILEVPEGKNVDDLPMSHFEKLAKKKGLSNITKALNNLQVWNKKKDPKLSKWAGDMIDKLNKKLKKDESVKFRKNIKESGMYDYYDVPNGALKCRGVCELARPRRNRNAIIDELEKQGWEVIDSGYEDYRYYEEKWRKKGYDVKSFYFKSDTPGLKMWMMWGKKRDSDESGQEHIEEHLIR